jgi:tetratricopeptide (TPR) repeat protein
MASELGVRYLLQGSLRKSGARMRISMQLIEAETGVHIWGERYDLEMTEVFAIQDEIAERVAGAIEPEFLKTEAALAASRHTGNMTAWDLVRQGTWRFHQVTRPTHFEARELFREACRVDPNLAEAHIWLARVSAGILAYGWSENPAADREEGFKAAFAGIRLDDRNPYSHYGLAIISVYGGDLDQAIRAAEKAVELNPSFALAHLVLGMARLFGGAASEAIGSLERGMQLHAFDPQKLRLAQSARLSPPLCRTASGGVGGRGSSCKGSTRLEAEPRDACLLLCRPGSGADARRCIEQAAELSPPPGDALKPLLERNPSWAERIESMLQKAGGTR